jgi:hypothetical protein
MRIALSLLVVLAAASPAGATPVGDLVLVWAPAGANLTPIAAAAQRAGAAVLDRSPSAPSVASAAPAVARAIAAYDALRFDEADTAIELARTTIDRTGAAGLTTAQLADLWLYRGLLATQHGDPVAAWDALVVSATVAPERVLDPVRFPPRVVEQVERAREQVAARPRAELAVDAPAGCETVVDGARLAPHAQVAAGPHWVRVTCADRAPWGGRVEVAAPATTVHSAPEPYAPLDDTDALIQARSSGARAFVVVAVVGEVATLRLVGIDGRERDRRSVAVHAGDLGPAGASLATLLAGAPPPRSHWYESRWAWAAAAVAVAAAVLVPVTASLAHDDRPTSGTLRIGGVSF